jgi:hypothetical protein
LGRSSRAGGWTWWLLLVVASVGNTLGSGVKWFLGRYVASMAVGRFCSAGCRSETRSRSWPACSGSRCRLSCPSSALPKTKAAMIQTRGRLRHPATGPVIARAAAGATRPRIAGGAATCACRASYGARWDQSAKPQASSEDPLRPLRCRATSCPGLIARELGCSARTSTHAFRSARRSASIIQPIQDLR